MHENAGRLGRVLLLPCSPGNRARLVAGYVPPEPSGNSLRGCRSGWRQAQKIPNLSYS